MLSKERYMEKTTIMTEQTRRGIVLIHVRGRSCLGSCIGLRFSWLTYGDIIVLVSVWEGDYVDLWMGE